MPKCPISGFVQVGKAAPIGFRLVVGLGQQANALIDSIVGVLSAIRKFRSNPGTPSGCLVVSRIAGQPPATGNVPFRESKTGRPGTQGV